MGIIEPERLHLDSETGDSIVSDEVRCRFGLYGIECPGGDSGHLGILQGRCAVEEMTSLGHSRQVTNTGLGLTNTKGVTLWDHRITPVFISGAEEKTRTSTGKPPLDPEPSASTNSATSATVW